VKNKKRGDKRSKKRGGTGQVDTRSMVRGGEGRSDRVDTRSMVRGGTGKVDTRSMVRGGEGRSDRVDTRSMVRGGTGKVDTRNMISGGEGRVDTTVSEVQDKEYCQLRSFWWQYSSDCALLASVCASYEAACHTFWSHEEWMYNLLLHTSDDHFLKLASEYKKFCVRGCSNGTCGVCGVTGLVNGGKKLTLKSLRYLIRRGDEYDDSRYGIFKRELRDATDTKAAAIAQLRLDTLHTYQHPNSTVYHIFEDGIINGEYCRVCSTCHTAVRYVCFIV